MRDLSKLRIWLFEILSPGKVNRERDLLVKRQLYARYGIEEYWIVDPENCLVAVYRQVEQSLESVSTVRDHERLTSSVFPGLDLDLQTIFAR
jgi:Uma2 family endonuclease